MRGTLTLAAIGVAFATAGCDGDDTAEITKAEVEAAGKAWPLTVDSGGLKSDRELGS